MQGEKLAVVQEKAQCKVCNKFCDQGIIRILSEYFCSNSKKCRKEKVLKTCIATNSLTRALFEFLAPAHSLQPPLQADDAAAPGYLRGVLGLGRGTAAGIDVK